SYESPNSENQITQLQVINDSTLVGIHDGGSFFKTEDSGETWETVDIIGSWVLMSLDDMHFSDSMNGYIISRFGGIYQTSNGGDTWTELLDLTFFDFGQFTSIYSLSSDILTAAGKGGLIFSTDDAMESFSANAIPLDIARAIDLADESTAFVKGEELLYHLDVATGEYFEVQPYWEESDSKNAFVFFDDQTGIGLDEGGQLRKTTDGAMSWIDIEVTESPAGQFTDFEFVDAQNGIVLEETSTLWKTNNGGTDWEEIFQGDVQIFDAVSATLFFLVNRDEAGQMNLMRSTDGGENWTELSDFFAFFFFELHFLNESTGFVSSSSGTRRTDDAGETWEINNSGLSHYQFLNNEVGLGLASQEVYYTDDGGMTWSPAGPNSGALAYSVEGDRIITLNQLYAIHTASLNTLSTEEIAELSQPLKVYPNPAQDDLTLVVPEGNWSVYELVHVSGKLLISEKIQNQEVLRIDLKELPSGFYLIRVIGEDSVAQAKVIKQ
ncbi:MAG: T9SS type A sorting domain-containing protein, partial [Cryomorphaceae bacterium]